MLQNAHDLCVGRIIPGSGWTPNLPLLRQMIESRGCHQCPVCGGLLSNGLIHPEPGRSYSWGPPRKRTHDDPERTG